MSWTVRITLEGLPERVNEIANALDAAVSDTIEWQDIAAAGDGHGIVIKGVGTREITAAISGSVLVAS